MICVDYYQANGGVTLTQANLAQLFENWDLYVEENGQIQKVVLARNGSVKN